MRARITIAAAALLCVLAAIRTPADAYAPSATIQSITGSPDVFTVNTMTNSLLSGSSTITVSLKYSTTPTGSGGSITILPPATLTGTSGNTLDTGDFSVQCSAPSFPTLFTSSGVVALSGTTTCATLPAGNHNAVVSFTITVYLDTTSGAVVPFTADTYSAGAFTITASAT